MELTYRAFVVLNKPRLERVNFQLQGLQLTDDGALMQTWSSLPTLAIARSDLPLLLTECPTSLSTYFGPGWTNLMHDLDTLMRVGVEVGWGRYTLTVARTGQGMNYSEAAARVEETIDSVYRYAEMSMVAASLLLSLAGSKVGKLPLITEPEPVAAAPEAGYTEGSPSES